MTEPVLREIPSANPNNIRRTLVSLGENHVLVSSTKLDNPAIAILDDMISFLAPFATEPQEEFEHPPGNTEASETLAFWCDEHGEITDWIRPVAGKPHVLDHDGVISQVELFLSALRTPSSVEEETQQ